MQGAYEIYKGQTGVRLSYLLSDLSRCSDTSIAVVSYTNYKQKARKQSNLKLRSGLGPGNEVLIAFDNMPEDWKSRCIDRFGNPKVTINAIEKFYKPDAAAKAFYDTFRFEDGDFLTPAQVKRYTLHASVLNALAALKIYRENTVKSRQGSTRNIWQSLAEDTVLFNSILKTRNNTQHSLPKNKRILKEKLDKYQKYGYANLIDGRNNNSNAQVVTPEMIKLWKDIYAGQRNHKPTYIEVSMRYNQFLAGQIEIVNTAPDSGEIYDHTSECYRPASGQTVYAYQELWENRAVTHSLRSGDRQRFKVAYEPYHKLLQPAFAGTIISIDDRQPPFEYAPGKRMWFYNAIDLGSEAFTCWVYGESKDGIIKDFYKQLVRNYHAWGVQLPYEIECEASLNSSFKDTFLQPGSMFQEVRIEANNARGKRIEAYYKQLRYAVEKMRNAWLARPFAQSESNQLHGGKKQLIPKNELICNCLEDIALWNNSLHSDQEKHPGMTRWDVFMDKQHPDLKPTNWAGILPYLGKPQKSSMHTGRILLQGKARVVGFDGKVALGERLINVMKKIEGKEVMIYWLDDNNGDVLQALVYDMEGTLVCELLDDLAYQRGKLEQTESDLQNRTLFSAYAATVQGYIRRNAREIEPVTIIEKPQPKSERFKIKGLPNYKPSDKTGMKLPGIDEPAVEDYNLSLSTADRY